MLDYGRPESIFLTQKKTIMDGGRGKKIRHMEFDM